MQQFVGPQPQHVAIGGRHPLQAPIGGNLLPAGASNSCPIPPHAGDQLAGESDQVVGPQAAVDQPVALGRIVARIQIVLIQDLEGDFAGSTATGHGGRD